MSPILNVRIQFDARDEDGNPVVVPDGFALQRLGPRVQVHVFPPVIEGEANPEPVTGHALIDTGASMTCVDRAAADTAGLAVVGEAPMTSATHENEIVPLHAGSLRIDGLPDYK